MNYCNICFLQKLQYNFLPCNHGLCNDCLEQLKKENCPYCRKKFDKSKILSQSQEYQDDMLLSTSEPIKILNISNPRRLARSVERKKRKKRKKPSTYYTKSKNTINTELIFVFDDEDEIQFSSSSI